MTEKNKYKIVSNFADFNQNLDALMYITNDVLMFRNQKLNNIDETISAIVDSETFNIEFFDKIYAENQKEFRDNDIYKHKFDFLFFNSIFINIFSLFEIYLNNLGKLCETFEANNIKIKDLNGNGQIDTIRKYFHLIFKIDFASNSENLWSQIEDFKAIRNSIVHNENKLNLNKAKNQKSIKGFKKIEQHKIKFYGEEMNFELNNVEFITDFINICKEYSGKLTKEIIKNYS